MSCVLGVPSLGREVVRVSTYKLTCRTGPEALTTIT